jgi:uncharacterized protein YjbI with pentapeptide repeats
MQKAKAQEARFIKARLNWADLTWTIFDHADFSGADLTGANLHAIHEDGTVWKGAETRKARRTELARLEAETFAPKK